MGNHAVCDLCRGRYVGVVRLDAALRSCSHEQGFCRVSTLAIGVVLALSLCHHERAHAASPGAAAAKVAGPQVQGCVAGFPLRDARRKRLVFQACAVGGDFRDVDLEYLASRQDGTRAAEIPSVCLEAGSIGDKLPRGHGAVARRPERPVPWGTTPSHLCRVCCAGVVRLGAALRSCSPSASCWFFLSATTGGRMRFTRRHRCSQGSR